MQSTHKTRQGAGRQLEKLCRRFTGRDAEPLEVRRLSSVPGERESRPGSGSGRRRRRRRQLGGLTADNVGAAGRRASNGSGVERSRAEYDVDCGSRRRRVVGVRETEVIKTGNVMVNTGNVMH